VVLENNDKTDSVRPAEASRADSLQGLLALRSQNSERRGNASEAEKSQPVIENTKQPQKPKKEKKKKKFYSWPIKAFLVTFLLAVVFAFTVEIITLNAPIVAIFIVIIVVLFIISVFFDIVALAVASADITPFYAMASRKQKGAKMSIKLLKNAEIVANICADIIGEVCSIVSGAAGFGVAFKIITELSFESDTWLRIFITVLVSAVIAAATVGTKALTKRFARNNSHKIVEWLGKVLSVFSRKN